MPDDYFDPIYKGSTAPAMVLGVPLLPFILGAVVIGQLAVLSFYFISLSVAASWLVIGAFAYMYARQVRPDVVGAAGTGFDEEKDRGRDAGVWLEGAVRPALPKGKPLRLT